MPNRILNAIAILLLLSSCASTEQVNLAGDWSGTLTAGGGSLRLIFHIAQADDGYDTLIESIDQGGTLIPTELIVDGDSLTFKVAQLDVVYTATVSGNAISGTFTQAGQSFPNFTITRSTPGE